MNLVTSCESSSTGFGYGVMECEVDIVTVMWALYGCGTRHLHKSFCTVFFTDLFEPVRCTPVVHSVEIAVLVDVVVESVSSSFFIDGYSTRDINYLWKGSTPVSVDDETQTLPQFEVKNYTTSRRIITLSTGMNLLAFK